MPDPRESPMDLTFPTRGVNVATEFELQPVGTTPTGRNVRTYEPSSARGRGGARPGLLKWLLDRVNGNAPVQHLNFIVTQAGESTLTDFEVEFGSTRRYRMIVDPSSNCRRDLAACTHEDMPDGGTNPPTAPPPGGTPGGGPPGGPNAPGTQTSGRNPPRIIRSGGSGIRPRRSGRYPPVANDDSTSAFYGGSAVNIPVLDNDLYDGTPTVTILSGPQAGSAGLLGNVIQFTPPASGSLNQVTIVYRLTATNNRDSDTATVTITLEGDTPGFRLMCRTFTSVYDLGEFGFPITVCACQDPATPDYTLTFGATGTPYIAGPFTGNTLPSVADVNAAADAYQVLNGSNPFDPPAYDGADPDVDSGPC